MPDHPDDDTGDPTVDPILKLIASPLWDAGFVMTGEIPPRPVIATMTDHPAGGGAAPGDRPD